MSTCSHEEDILFIDKIFSSKTVGNVDLVALGALRKELTNKMEQL